MSADATMRNVESTDCPAWTGNHHSTAKPAKLVTTTGGLLLNPNADSGSTGQAAVIEGLRLSRGEQDPTYPAIAEARIAAAFAAAEEDRSLPAAIGDLFGGLDDGRKEAA